MEKDKEINQKKLSCIPKTEQYISYMLNMIMKLPRTEKYSIGTEYKKSMYQMLEQMMYLNRIGNNEEGSKKEEIRKECINRLNHIDMLLNCQRIYLRIMKNNYWVDEKKFLVAIEKIYEIGKIVGGLIKYYGKNNKK